MAFADLGMMGTAGTTTANQNNLVCTATTAGAAVGNLVVVAVAVDNRVTGGGDDLSVSDVTDSVGNTYVKARQEATNLAAQAGSSVSIWWSRIKTAIPVTTGTITAAFTTNTTSDAQCMAVRKYSVGSGNFVQVAGTAGGTSTTTNPGSLNVTTLNREYLRIRAIGCEYDVTQALTVTAGGWAAWTEIASAATGTTSEQVLEVEWLINTGTGTASAPTLGSACDNSSVYVAFQEVTPVPEIIDPPKKTVRTTSQTVAIIATLSAVAESVFVPPSVAASTSAAATSGTVVVTSRCVYDQTSAPVFVPPSVVAPTPTSAAATSGTVVVTSRRIYDQTSAPVFIPAPVVVTITPVVSSDAATRTRRKILPDGYTVLVTVPAAAATTPSTVDATWRQQRKTLPDSHAAPVFKPVVAVAAVPFVPDAPQSGFARPQIKPIPLSSYVLAYPAPTALTPTDFGYQTVEAAYSPRLRVKPVPLSAFVFEVDDIESVPSPASNSYSTATVITRRVVYDPITGPVLPPIITPPIDTALASVQDEVQAYFPRSRVKPVPLSAFVFEVDDIESEREPLPGVHSTATVITRKVVYDPITGPVFPPVFVGVPGRFVPDAPQSFIKHRIKAVPLSAFVFAYPVDDLAQDPSEQFIRQKRKVLPDGIAQPPFRPIVPTQTPSAFDYQTVDVVWRKQRKVLPDGIAQPQFQPAAAVTISSKLAGAYSGTVVVTSRRVYSPTAAPAFRPLTATPVAFGYQTVDAVWRKQKKVLPDGYAKPLLPPVFVPPVVPPTVGGGGPGFSYQRYERLLEELYKKKKKAPPKAKKALAKAIAVVKQVDTRAEDLARLLQALEAAAAISTQNTLATINAANAAAEQARLVLEQQRLRQLREEDDLILLMLDEDD